MSSGRPISFRASAAAPCPVCASGSKGCSATDDSLHLCRGEPGDGWRAVGDQADSAGFLHYRRTEDRPPPGRRPAPPDWRARAERFARAMTAGARVELAAALNLPVEALDALPLIGVSGESTGGRTFAFPESDAAGAVIGLNDRGPTGAKRVQKGGKRGLTLPTGWRDRSGVLLIVEGASDTLAGTHAGLAVVGRPSANGGAKLLAELLKGWPADRPLVVMGENDRKPNGDWPGRDGAAAVARTLSAALRRRVPVGMPPDGAKDVRAWLTDPARGAVGWADRGTVLVTDVFKDSPPAADDGQAAVDDFPVIEVGTDEHRVNDEAAAALGREPDVYQRAGMLVFVREQDREADAGEAVRRPVGAPAVRELSRPLLRERLTRCARWQAWRGNGENAALAPAHPPDWSVAAVHGRGSWPGVRRLEAVVNYPLLLPDGSLLAASGYHPAARVLASLPPGLRVDVPDRPTRADVAAAVAALLDPVQDVPFEKPEHKAAFVAALLTPLAFHAFDGSAPMFPCEANTRAAGKGLTVDVVSLALTGRRFPVMSYTHDPEEMRKRITSLAVSGEGMVLLDNLTGAVGSGVLDAAMTTDRWSDRLLGVNVMFDGSLNVVWYATGNNVQYVGDLSRRVCPIRLETPLERPETKSGFRYPDLRAHVRGHRGGILSAALTILRGWHVAGRPRHGLLPWGSFEGWSGVVREAIVFAGLPDPGLTREEVQAASDRDAASMGVVIEGLEKLDGGGRGLTTAEIVRRVKEDESGAEWVDDLRSAIEELCGKLDGRTLGNKLRHFKRRNFGGRMVDAPPGGKHACRWRVYQASPPVYASTRTATAEGGEGGEGGQFRPGQGGIPGSTFDAGGGEGGEGGQFPPATARNGAAANPSSRGDTGDEGDVPARTGKQSPDQANTATGGEGGERGQFRPAAGNLWDDVPAFDEVMKVAGWAWNDVLAWLSATHRVRIPSGGAFFSVASAHRQLAYQHLLTKPGRCEPPAPAKKRGHR